MALVYAIMIQKYVTMLISTADFLKNFVLKGFVIRISADFVHKKTPFRRKVFVVGGPTWDRTKDQPVMSRGLYR